MHRESYTSVSCWRKLRRLNAVCLLVCAATGCGTSQDGSSPRIGMMPKLVGISYFDATKQGAVQAAKELNVELVYDGPTEASVEDQAKMIDGWIAQGFDVVAVAPNDPESISTPLQHAIDAGAKVLTWDTDANAEKSRRCIFVNQAPNEAIGNTLVDIMADGVQRLRGSLQGKYLIVSGTATAANQNAWMEVMRARIAEKYPEMQLLPHLTPGEDHSNSQEQTRDAISANPDLVGIWGITSVSLPASAKAVRDSGKSGQIFVTGLSLPSMVREYVADGTIEKLVLWDAVDLGYLTVHIAKRLLDGDLPPGIYDFGRLKEITVTEDQAILGPPLVFTADNIAGYQF